MSVEEILVYVYKDKKLQGHEHFKSLNQAHAFCEKKVSLGHFCELQRFDNGRIWAKIKFCPKESI